MFSLAPCSVTVQANFGFFFSPSLLLSPLSKNVKLFSPHRRPTLEMLCLPFALLLSSFHFSAFFFWGCLSRFKENCDFFPFAALITGKTHARPRHPTDIFVACLPHESITAAASERERDDVDEERKKKTNFFFFCDKKGNFFLARFHFLFILIFILFLLFTWWTKFREQLCGEALSATRLELWLECGVAKTNEWMSASFNCSPEPAPASFMNKTTTMKSIRNVSNGMTRRRDSRGWDVGMGGMRLIGNPSD